MWTYAGKYYEHMLTLLGQHLMLTGLSLLIAMCIALPVGFLLSRVKWLAVPVMSVLGVIYTIPSLAFLAMLIPLVGLGTEPAVIALVAYSQLILVRNVMAGFRAVDPAIREAGLGMGLSSWQLFWRIEVPLALPVILGGLRIAAISVIGIATVAAWINAGGLGVLLFEGLYQNSTPKIVWGTLLVALLAIVSNQTLLWLEKRAHRKARGGSGQ
ncbi:MAG: ABC transporter permease [Tumebacillaceae bacterium]